MSYKKNITIKLTSPAIHTEEVQSNISSTYKEPYLLDNTNEIIHIPVIKGNSLRGQMRDLIMNYALNKVGVERASLNVDLFYILFSGGFLDGMRTDLDIAKKKELRQTFPPLSIFGSAMGKEMLKGKMIISSARPRIKEIRGDGFSVYDLTSIVRMTRLDDGKMPNGEHWIKEESLSEEEKRTMQMFYDIEVINSGTIMDIVMVLDSDNEIEKACFNKAISLFVDKGTLGGKSSAGFGRFEVMSISDEDNYAVFDLFLEENKEKIKGWINEWV